MRFFRPFFFSSLLFLSGLSPLLAATVLRLNYQPTTVVHAMVAKGSALKTLSTTTDFNQTTHQHMQQTYRGYRVWGGDVIVHTPEDHQAATINGVLYQDLENDLSKQTLAFNAAQADQATRQAIELYQLKSGNKQPVEQVTHETIVYVDEANKAHWAYWVSFTVRSADSVLAKPNYILDAATLSTYRQWNDLPTLENVQAGGFGGNQNTGRFAYDGLHGNLHLTALTMQRDASKKICYLQNTDVVVKDERKADAVVSFPCDAIHPEYHEYWDANLNETNGGYSPDNDALFTGKIVKDMYRNWYKLDALTHNGKPMQLIMRVHADMDNAYWDGEQMTFGDGVSLFYPLVSLGIAAHEVSHGFTQQHANLVYEWQSGGINEAFSDMAAQAAEFYAYGHNTWEIGTEIFKEKNKAIRYMDHPSKDCEGTKPPYCSIDHVKQYIEGMEVHYSSGIFNRLFYLMSTSLGWNTKKAFDVMVAANMNYWTPNVTFIDAACGMLRATRDYHYNRNDVVHAMTVVGLDAKDCKF